MNLRSRRNRVLDPLERFSEILFGLIMVLSFTCAFSVTPTGRDDVRGMALCAITCNLAWGLIDAVFYLIACLTEKGHHRLLLRTLQRSTDTARKRKDIAGFLPAKIAEALRDDDFDRIRTHLEQLPPPARRPRLTANDWRGALGVFLLVFLSTFPVVIPFFAFSHAQFALRFSNGVAMVMLFGAGYMLAGYAGLRRIPTGLGMVALGAALVALTIALGG